MLRRLGLACLLLSALFFCRPASVQVLADEYEEWQEHDITGDKVKEKITLEGELTKDGMNLREAKLKISGSSEAEITVSGGSQPKLMIADLDHDGVKDIFLTIKPMGEKNEVVGWAVSFKEGEFIRVDAPRPIVSEAAFRDDYEAVVELAGKEYVLDLSKKKEEYEELGMYHNGKLNEPQELMVGGFSSMKPTYMLKGKGIVALQPVSGMFEADTLGHIKTVWYLDKEEWMLEKASFIPR